MVQLGVVLVCTLIGWLCGRPVIGLIAGLALLLLSHTAV